MKVAEGMTLLDRFLAVEQAKEASTTDPCTLGFPAGTECGATARWRIGNRYACDGHYSLLSLIVTRSLLLHFIEREVDLLDPARVEEAKRLKADRDAREVTYVMQRQGWVKIGHSTNLDQRFRALTSGGTCHCPPEMDEAEHLTLLATFPGNSEKDLHIRFADYRDRGEWFRIEGAVAEWIQEGCPE